jgi:hypothetical protein
VSVTMIRRAKILTSFDNSLGHASFERLVSIVKQPVLLSRPCHMRYASILTLEIPIWVDTKVVCRSEH